MKLAEALLLRSDLQTKLASLQQRINNNVLIQEGDQPSEDANALIQEAFAVNQQLHQLIQRIHFTNTQAKSIEGNDLLTVLNQRDLLTQQHRVLQQAIDSSRRENGRYSSSEIRWVKTISVADLQKQADAISQQLRKNNLEIQASNWQVELV
ncbi:septicolysin [Acinetobacter sp. TGL-Y2]|uniref:DIP1984 family protein n=1 Tax=Acinetobacter sp. TGL-Y2 TaxID=1407071 RepID=UPI0007A67666|nr:DIP1984 family protein [Acinetobacter sp. TGL-Y2]AMW79579.1 septicolysin [Acinetobacter sp. TGL-Y2]